MTLFLISLNPATDIANQDKFTEAMESFSGHWQEAPGTWIIKSSLNAAQVRDHIKQFLGPDDGILVCGLTGEVAWRGFSEESSLKLKGLL